MINLLMCSSSRFEMNNVTSVSHIGCTSNLAMIVFRQKRAAFNRPTALFPSSVQPRTPLGIDLRDQALVSQVGFHRSQMSVSGRITATAVFRQVVVMTNRAVLGR